MWGGDTGDGKAATTASSEEQTTEYKNWIELGIGGVITSGDRAQFEQEHRLPGDEVFGGIQDLHYEQAFGKNGTFAIDGHAIWDTNDYDVKLDLTQPNVGYIRAGFTEFRSWYDGNGGFFPHNSAWFPPPLPEMHIDRGEAWVELGLRLPDWPEITLRYSHDFRDGQKDSTIWGDTTLTGLTVNRARKIVPAFRDIDEKRDIVALDATKTFGNTEVTLGMRYEHIDNDDSLKMERGAGQLPPVVSSPGTQRFVTQRDDTNGDLFSGHAITETRLTDSLWFTTGYSYTTLGNDIGGSRIFGTHFDAAFGEPIPTLGPFDEAFVNLAGTTESRDHVFNLNLLWMPWKTLTVLTAFRYTREDKDSESTFLSLEAEPNVPPFTPTNPAGGFHFGEPSPVSAERVESLNRFAERLELRYTGIRDWLFYFSAEWDEEFGDVDQRERGPDLDEEDLVPLIKDTNFLGQKYAVGANWYPTMRLSLSAQYYHKIGEYDNDVESAAHQRLLEQDWNTDDANVRVTWRPKIPTFLGTLALVTRYDFVRTTIDSKWALFSDEEVLGTVESGVITRHMISEAVTWNPLARLYLQGDVSYVLDQTETPASKIVLVPYNGPTVLNFRNDYWTATVAAGYLLDANTDVRAEYTFYHATDYVNNAAVGLPYGISATEHTASLGVSRQLNKQVRVSVRYSYFNYTDETFGGHNNYEAHSIYSGLQYRF